MQGKRLIRPGEPFTQAEIDDGTAELEPVEPMPAPPPIEQDEHWPGDWGLISSGDA